MPAFRSELEHAVNARHSRMNPFTDAWVTGKLTRPQLGQWVCQHFQYVGQFSQWCAAVYAGCPDSDARDLARMVVIASRESASGKVELALHSFGTLIFQRLLQHCIERLVAVKGFFAASQDHRIAAFDADPSRIDRDVGT